MALSRRFKRPLTALCIALIAALVDASGPGHALLFQNHVLMKTDFKDFPTTELTFEGWFSTSDTCHNATLMSYALDSDATSARQRGIDYNHFVVFNPYSIIACHDFYYLELRPDPAHQGCRSSFTELSGVDDTVSMISRTGEWHHLAVTWHGESGEMKIYFNGLLMARAVQSGQGQRPQLEPGGALVLGGEQDCFGGCMDDHQGYYGLMDEVRIWKTVRSQHQIINTMRATSGLGDIHDLVAWWQFNDYGEGRRRFVAKDSSPAGNHLELVRLPKLTPDTQIPVPRGGQLTAGAISLKNNFAMNSWVTSMPEADFTVELWARTPEFSQDLNVELYYELFSFASTQPGNGLVSDDSFEYAGKVMNLSDAAFLDDSIRIRKLYTDYGQLAPTDAVGTVVVHVNSNSQGNGQLKSNWVAFLTHWSDKEWHHIAVSWTQSDGALQLLFDGEPQKAFWKSSGSRQSQDFDQGISSNISAGTWRSSNGSIVLGQDQECYAGCFGSQYAFDGDLAVLRVWDRARTPEEVREDMARVVPRQRDGLQYLWDFRPVRGKSSAAQGELVRDGVQGEVLHLGSDTPLWVPSTAPLHLGAEPREDSHFLGHALRLDDMQVAIAPRFTNFPQHALTIEFWMLSVDTCRSGAMVSYALPDAQYRDGDNAFLIFDTNDIGVSVMEDEGGFYDHNSGFAATDGRWHHIAVTWDMPTGRTVLYDNGRVMWRVRRSNGTAIVPGGVFILGREQDCAGGCFDSDAGALGHVDLDNGMEYGSQDFYGLIDDTRVWSRELSQQEILDNIRRDTGAFTSNLNDFGSFRKPGVNPRQKHLEAYWRFDEGSGYRVFDLTGNQQHLSLQGEPRWEAVEWLAVCGDGLVSPGEECDDGQRNGGDGCSTDCTVEPGWACSTAAPSLPSVCFRQDAEQPSLQPSFRGAGKHGHSAGPNVKTASSGGGSSSRGSGGGGGLLVALLVLLVVALLAGLAYAKRDAIYVSFPQVRHMVGSVRRRLGLKGEANTVYGPLVDETGFADLPSQPSTSSPSAVPAYEAIGSSS